MYKIVVVLISFFITVASADDFDTLLHDYHQASDLSLKTKNEAIGNIIVYTRNDLERMQVNSLKDVLKSMRFFSYRENRLGLPDLINADPVVYNSSTVRIYLNDHELNTPMLGSGISSFGDMELGFIDHLEIYQGFPSFDFGTEPATIVIRLYSKTAEHDTGSSVKAQFGTYGSNILNAYFADEIDDISYYIYASRYDNRRKDVLYDNQNLKRDRRTEQFYLSVASQNHHFEVQASHSKGNLFMGAPVSIDSPLSVPNSSSVPSGTNSNDKFISASLHSRFQEDTLILNASLVKNVNKYNSLYTPSLSFRPSPNPLGQVQLNSMSTEIVEDSYTINLTKKWKTKNNTFSSGVKFRHNYFSQRDLNLDAFLFIVPNVQIPVPLSANQQPYSSTNIYSAFLNDEYSINDNQIVTLSLMMQEYDNRNTDIKNHTLFQSRFGYIYTNEQWVAKTFITSQEFAPSPYQVVSPSSFYSNTKLDKSDYISIFQEIRYQTEATDSKIVFGYTETNNFVLPGSNLQLENSKNSLSVLLASLEETIHFSQNDKLELQLYVSSLDSSNSQGYISTHGGLIRMLNTINEFDIFNLRRV